MTADEYAVLSAILRGGYVLPGQRRLVIQDTTVAPPLRAGQAAALEASGSPELVADYRARNEQPAVLADKLSLPVSYTRTGAAELGRVTGAAGWSAFNQRYPRANGYVTVSRVGFDPAYDLAMVSVVHNIAAGVGRATMFVLARVDGRWDIVDAYPLSVS
jgi:hypothetical protein